MDELGQELAGRRRAGGGGRAGAAGSSARSRARSTSTRCWRGRSRPRRARCRTSTRRWCALENREASRSSRRSASRRRKPNARPCSVRPIDGRGARAISMSYEYGRGGGRGRRRRGDRRSGVAVPLPGETASSSGWLTVFTRALDDEGSARAQVSGSSRSSHSARGRRSRTRGATARRAGCRPDALTGLRNRRYFHEALAREGERAQRYRRQPRADRVRPRRFQGDQRASGTSPEMACSRGGGADAPVVRGADIACRVGGDEFAVVLPEAGSGRRPSSTRGSGTPGRPRRSASGPGDDVGRCRGGRVEEDAGSRSSSAPTTRSTARRKPARAARVAADRKTG